jgi:hypothetical protein
MSRLMDLSHLHTFHNNEEVGVAVCECLYQSTKISLVWTRTSYARQQHGKKVYEWAPALTRSLGRPKNRWEDDVKSDITKMKITNWKDCIRNQPKWKECVEKAKTSLKL